MESMFVFSAFDYDSKVDYVTLFFFINLNGFNFIVLKSLDKSKAQNTGFQGFNNAYVYRRAFSLMVKP